MINLAVIGTSNITFEFVTAALKSGRYNLSAVYSRTEQKGKDFADKFGCKTVYTSLLDLGNDKQITTVYIASPNGLHYEQSKLMLEFGKNVICEKTITEHPKQYKELKSLADKKSLIYVDAIMSRYSFGREAIKNAIKEIGNITLARIDFSKFSARYIDYKNGEDVNIFNMALGGGTLMDLGVYCVYAAVDLFGMPNTITAFANFLRDGADGGGTAVFNYNGFDAVLTYSKTGEGVLGSEIIGDKGAVKIAKIGQFIEASLIKGNNTKQLVGTLPKIEVMMGEVVAFADFIENGSKDAKFYDDISQLTYNVLLCMEEIKSAANIKYR